LASCPSDAEESWSWAWKQLTRAAFLSKTDRRPVLEKVTFSQASAECARAAGCQKQGLRSRLNKVELRVIEKGSRARLRTLQAWRRQTAGKQATQPQCRGCRGCQTVSSSGPPVGMKKVEEGKSSSAAVDTVVLPAFFQCETERMVNE
jgi:hypothetical protein